GTTLSIATLRRMATSHPDRVTVLDLDWRPMAWTDKAEFPPRVRRVLPLVDIVVGGDGEFEAAGMAPAAALDAGVRLVVLQRGPGGVSLLTREGEQPISPIPVEVSCALGAGDAFLAAFVAGIAEGRGAADAVARGNAAGAIVATRPTCSLAMPTV